MRHLYGVFNGSKWGMTTRKAEAVKVAKSLKAYVRVMPYPVGPGTTAWDASTFKIFSELLADYRWDGGVSSTVNKNRVGFTLSNKAIQVVCKAVSKSTLYSWRKNVRRYWQR